MQKWIFGGFAIVLIASVFYWIDSTTAAAANEIDRCAQQRMQAIADFNKGEFKVAYSHCDVNSYYAEEIFFRQYRLKIDMARFDGGCIIPSHEIREDEKRYCYYQVIDSLLFKQFGTTIYTRVQGSADSFALAAPHRYDSQPFGTPVYIPTNDSIISDLRKVLRYPTRDCIEGVVYVDVEIDTSGTISKALVKKGVRRDLDSAAVAGTLKLGKFTPVRRWGIPKIGHVVLPVRFSRY